MLLYNRDMSIGIFLIILGIFTNPVFFVIGLFFLINDLNRKSNNSNDKINNFKRNNRRRERDDHRYDDYRFEKKKYSDDTLDDIYKALNRFFENHDSYAVTRQINLRSKHKINDQTDIDVYFDNTYLCTLEEFSNTHPKEWEKIMNSLSDFAKAKKKHKDDVVDATFEEVDDKEVKRSETTLSKAARFAKQVDDFNNMIPDYRISLKLDKTSSLLRQVSTLEEKNSSDLTSLEKLYDYYMPMLNDILKSFVQLQNQTMHHDHEATVGKVSDVIDTINNSMQTIINDMNDEDFINLNADLNTLETLLKNDGLVTDSKLDISKAKAKASENANGITLTLTPNETAKEQEEIDESIKMELDDKIGQINDKFKSDSLSKG